MDRSDWSNIFECKNPFIFKDFFTRNFTFDNLTK